MREQSENVRNIQHQVKTILKYLLYYLLLTNVFRYSVILKNTIEASQLNAAGLLAAFIVFDKVGDLYRFTTGGAMSIINGQQLYKYRKEILKDTKEKRGKKAAEIIGKSVFRSMVIDSAFIPIIFVSASVAKRFGYLPLTSEQLHLLYVYLLSKWFLIQGATIRNVLDLTNPGALVAIAASLQMYVALAYYAIKILVFKTNVSLVDMTVCSYLGGISYLLMNCFAFYTYMGTRVSIRWVSPIRVLKRMGPWMITALVNGVQKFCLVEALEVFSIVKSPQERIIEGIFFYSLIKTMMGTVELPLLSSIRVSAPDSKNEKSFLIGSYISTAIILLAFGIAIPLLLRLGIYQKLFFLKRALLIDELRIILILVPLVAIAKTVEAFNIVKANKLYTVTVVVSEIASVISYNMFNLVFPGNVYKRLMCAIFTKHIVYYTTNVAIATRLSEFCVKREILHCLTSMAIFGTCSWIIL